MVKRVFHPALTVGLSPIAIGLIFNREVSNLIFVAMAGLTIFFGAIAIVIHTRLPYFEEKSVFFAHLRFFVVSALLHFFPYDAATLPLVFQFWPTFSLVNGATRSSDPH